MDDAEIVRLAVAGDARAFEDLVRRHTAPVWRYAFAMLRDEGSAEEAVQDTFMKAHGALGTFRGESAVLTWLLSICSRSCLDRLRRRRLDVVPLDSVDEVGDTDSVDERVTVNAAISALAVEEREAFVLMCVLGHTRDAASRISGVAPSTLGDRLVRAREQLANSLSDFRTGDS